MALLARTVASLQKLLDACHSYAGLHNIGYNTMKLRACSSKTISMSIFFKCQALYVTMNLYKLCRQVSVPLDLYLLQT